ncbi:glycosyl hydrolase family 61-domain-containing protein [Lophiotrema nucula]|uniref:lytic cellulose monooxygenase (C4-dehydrogenating) n=1 Tax=Lophiotrema nucula TaxID=690887 RepID=A0A6A5ZP80_9PLEO|nr:glycosyl hydrolase family 61-domain-containing protein [Lophiotrema nucula]
MPFIKLVAALAVLAPLASGHFKFVRLSQNGVWKTPLQGIRNNTADFWEDHTIYGVSPFHLRTYMEPTFYGDFPESLRCGRDNMAWANGTEVLTINAGDGIEIAHVRQNPDQWEDSMFYNCPNGRATCYTDGYPADINHPGPLLVHLSKVPDGQDVRTYDGSGEWIKIFTMGLELRPNETNPVHWLPYNNQGLPPRFTFKIPAQVPAGQYLMRMDILWPGYYYDPPYSNLSNVTAQHYPSCGQLNIISDSKTPLPQGVKIPEIFSPNSTGMTTNYSMYELKKLEDGYEYPGGLLWDGEKLIVDKAVR